MVSGSALAGLALIAGAFFAFSNNGWSNSLWYSIEYGVGFDDVRTDPKPSDCDFMRAPLGDKGCGYKAYVQVFNADGVVVGGLNAPMFGTDTKTAKPILSYDGGERLGLVTRS